MSRCTLDPVRCHTVSVTGLSPSMAGFPKTILLPSGSLTTVRTPACTHTGLGSFPFARRYSGNRVFFLFLRLLRCFRSPGSLPYVMDWRMDNWRFSSWVSPFRNLLITGYLLLPEAFRSLSRLSSALSAKASTLRSSSLNLHIQHSVAGVRPGFFTSSWASSSRTLPTTSCDHLPMISSDVLNILRIVVFCMRFSRYTSFI